MIALAAWPLALAALLLPAPVTVTVIVVYAAAGLVVRELRLRRAPRRVTVRLHRSAR